MERTIGAVDVRRRLGNVLDEVATKGDHYIVERHGEPVAVVVPLHLYEQWRRQRNAFFDRVEAAARRANMSEEEGMALANEAVRAVRAQRRQR
jgi:prevent-host-death family protein